MSTTFRVNEKTTARYTCTVRDELGTGLGAPSLSTLTLTHYDEASGQVLNVRNAQNVLNQNGVTLDANGNLEWIMTPADNAIVNSTLVFEPHIALFEWTYGAKAGRHEVRILVSNLAKVS